jgi:7-cyano-7-deazaguanine synthase
MVKRKEQKNKILKKAVILLSGGIDSAACLASAVSRGYECYCLSFDYRQRHSYELKCARKIARRFKAKGHIVIKIDLRKWGGSALTSDKIKVPDAGTQSGIPATYVPARNLIFLSLAGAYAESLGAREIFIGVNSLDYSGYPDCRPEFIKSFQKTLNIGCKSGVEGKTIKIQAPLQKLSKSEIIKLAVSLGLDISMTSSCYNPEKNGKPCGKCDSCEIRAGGEVSLL